MLRLFFSTSGVALKQQLENLMRRIALLVLLVLASVLGTVSPANAGSWCNNGSYSSNSGRGTCSHNGGVNKNFNSFSDPGSSSYNRNNGFGSNNRNNGFSNNYNNGFSNNYNNGFGSSKKCASWQSFC